MPREKWTYFIDIILLFCFCHLISALVILSFLIRGRSVEPELYPGVNLYPFLERLCLFWSFSAVKCTTQCEPGQISVLYSDSVLQQPESALCAIMAL